MPTACDMVQVLAAASTSTTNAFEDSKLIAFNLPVFAGDPLLTARAVRRASRPLPFDL